MSKVSFLRWGSTAVTVLFAAVMAWGSSATTNVRAHERNSAERTAWPPETISGTILQVLPAQRLLIVKGPDGVPFDMRINKATRIESGQHRLMFRDLTTDQGKNVSIHFVPERSGDVAQRVNITG